MPGGQRRTTVVAFIVRRLIATVLLLIVVSMITFAIFFLIPRLAGQNAYQLATGLVGQTPTRATVLETMGEDYIRTARAKDLPERTVIVRHGLRAALTPIVTIFGMDLGALLGGAVITEHTFSLNGLGQFTILAIDNQDLPEILGVTMLAAFFIIIANLVVDIMYAVVDPRVRH